MVWKLFITCRVILQLCHSTALLWCICHLHSIKLYFHRNNETFLDTIYRQINAHSGLDREMRGFSEQCKRWFRSRSIVARSGDCDNIEQNNKIKLCDPSQLQATNQLQGGSQLATIVSKYCSTQLNQDKFNFYFKHFQIEQLPTKCSVIYFVTT